MDLPFSLSGRTALIAGASSGLGAHFAQLFARAGAQVVLGARRTDRTAELVSAISDAGGQALAVPLDVTDEGSIIAAYDAAEDAFDTVDSIVANAGLSASGRTTDLPMDDVERLVATNFTGVYAVAREGAKRLIASGSRQKENGRITIIGSITSRLNANGDSAYAATKAGVTHLGRNMAREWVRQGVNVNTIHPGYIATEIQGDWYQTDGGKAQIAGFHRRRLQEMDSLDAMMLYFASDASRSVTGSDIVVDDGQSL
ncbi:NADP-dependent 3-hydroxy acid dehydrogenase YdfG [Parasphingorhabdus marina DSM 22363]|uniref:NADP-dependent 3-hydroxy acid dehydrogenase YdfG n=1 Tax=Parasphingorhabdus marina DSM 22363 TaxID=1123272 RepID=A0A1N6CMJ9_9SPHN|nr:SDR family NAD(P)-dependent oxidoreductase [Parasphingorhabdus marina]SIN59800.1 NADP-dependent 3-hydroxy acid dehydrogenase YdfG [Parasphingorhabdus marina DSM 22363]